LFCLKAKAEAEAGAEVEAGAEAGGEGVGWPYLSSVSCVGVSFFECIFQLAEQQFFGSACSEKRI
jgi:hypothetical protein